MTIIKSKLESTRAKILRQIKTKGRGKFVFPADFIAIASADQVKLALSRLVKDEEILRLGNGIYYYPVIDIIFGAVYPSLEEIARAVAKRDHVTITPTEATAMNALGLSTQVPVNVVFLTNGPSKVIKVGKNKITFRNISNKRSTAPAGKLGLVIRALEGWDEETLKPKQKQALLKQLNEYSDKQISSAAQKTVRRVADILIKYLNSRNDQLAKS